MKRRHLSGLAVTACLLFLGTLVSLWSLTGNATAQSASPDLGNCVSPSFVAGSPQPTSVQGPDQPSSSAPVTAVGTDGEVQTLTPVCQWTYTFDPPTGDPTVHFTQYSNAHLAAGTQYTYNYDNSNGVSCHMTVEALNGFGGGGAQETLNSSNCNTDGYAPGEGVVRGFLTNGSSGAADTVASFNTTVTSFASGANISYGYFNACSENPVGSHTNYACDYFYGGPSL